MPTVPLASAVSFLASGGGKVISSRTVLWPGSIRALASCRRSPDLAATVTQAWRRYGAWPSRTVPSSPVTVSLRT
jgi:hypothetical protein